MSGGFWPLLATIYVCWWWWCCCDQTKRTTIFKVLELSSSLSLFSLAVFLSPIFHCFFHPRLSIWSGYFSFVYYILLYGIITFQCITATCLLNFVSILLTDTHYQHMSHKKNTGTKRTPNRPTTLIGKRKMRLTHGLQS